MAVFQAVQGAVPDAERRLVGGDEGADPLDGHVDGDAEVVVFAPLAFAEADERPLRYGAKLRVREHG